MNLQEQKRAAKEFLKRWEGRGDEKQDCQSFWTDFLEHVLGVPYAASAIQFEKKIDFGKDAKTGRNHTGFIDGYIPSTKVLIEQKGAKIDLKKGVAQSDGTELTPYQQAKRYADRMTNDLRPRWIVVSNFQEIHVYDLNENLDAPKIELTLADLEKESYQLDFLVDKEKVVGEHELQISLQAGELVGLLYDALEKQYDKPMTPEAYLSLNKLCVRLVFCLYAEDSGLFGTKSQFHDYLVTQGKIGITRIHSALRDLFRILNTKKEERDKYEDAELNAFPYVNGGLFADDKILIPPFSQEAFDLLVNKASAGFDWAEISPTIFGSVFESTLNAETRRQGGMHYTSIENIHKVIDSLFFDELKAEFETLKKSVPDKAKITPKKRKEFQEFQQKLGSLKFLDPACGSGNFLTETYLSLRRLENDVLREISGGQVSFGEVSPICVHINQFYGIEINDFAAVVAKTALWIAESQMMMKTKEIVEVTEEFLPLKSAAHIVEGNALRMDWNDVVPATELNYIMGNPPFLGYSNQNAEQKSDIKSVYVDENGKEYDAAGKIDYVSGWYFKAAQFVNGSNIRVAFVSTNSITQGEQVISVWKPLYDRFGIDIDFAWKSFVWNSEATSKAHVHCVIVGFSNSGSGVEKKLYDDDGKCERAGFISPYLSRGYWTFVRSRSTPICDVPAMVTGNRPADGGALIIKSDEYDSFISKEPGAKKFIKNLVGADEFINGEKRYCLWLVGVSPAEYTKLPLVMKRIAECKKARLAGADDRKKLAETPTIFRETKNPEHFMIVPATSGETRKYIPIGFLDKDYIPTNAVTIIPDATQYQFGVLTSSVHMAWMRAVGGRLESRYRYSKDVVYNNFIWPTPTDAQKAEIEKTAHGILVAREKYTNSSLADLYNELSMPPDLLKAHKANDKAVMKAYGFKSSMTEAEIVAELFKLYQKKLEEISAIEAKKAAEASAAKAVAKAAKKAARAKAK